MSTSSGSLLSFLPPSPPSPSTPSPKPDTTRKLYHTVLMRMQRQGVNLKVACKVDPHSSHVAEQVYCCLNEEDDWMLGKQLFEAVMGSPVEWPKIKVFFSPSLLPLPYPLPPPPNQTHSQGQKWQSGSQNCPHPAQGD